MSPRVYIVGPPLLPWGQAKAGPWPPQPPPVVSFASEQAAEPGPVASAEREGRGLGASVLESRWGSVPSPEPLTAWWAVRDAPLGPCPGSAVTVAVPRCTGGHSLALPTSPALRWPLVDPLRENKRTELLCAQIPWARMSSQRPVIVARITAQSGGTNRESTRPGLLGRGLGAEASPALGLSLSLSHLLEPPGL